MEIQFKRNHGFELIFKAENVNVCVDIEERIYNKEEDGKISLKGVSRDIKTDAIEQFVSILDDIIYYRKADFDSTELIFRLIEKLPKDKFNQMVSKFKKEYEL